MTKSFDILIAKKVVRDKVLEQKRLAGNLFSIKDIEYIEEFDSNKTADALAFIALSRRINKSKMFRGHNAPERLATALGLDYRHRLRATRVYINSNNPTREVFRRVIIETKLNSEHRVIKNKVITNLDTIDSRVVYTVSTENSEALKDEAIHLVKIYRDYTYNEIVNLRSMPVGKQMQEIINKAKHDLAESSLKPTSTDKSSYVGIEIECASSLNTDSMIDFIASKKSSLAKYVRVGNDGSIRTEEKFPYAIEFRLMVKEQDKDKVIKEFLEVTRGKLKVNSSCGLHVHLDMRNREYGSSFEKLYVAMPILMSMVPSSRRSNTYCKENNNKKAWRGGTGDRYQVLNPTSYRKYKTLEVRVHSATLSALKIINWVDLLLCVIDKKFDKPSLELTTTNKAAKVNLAPDRQIRSLIRFFDRFDVPARLRNYVVRRIAKFGKTDTLIVPKELSEAVPVNVTALEEESMQEESA